MPSTKLTTFSKLGYWFAIDHASQALFSWGTHADMVLAIRELGFQQLHEVTESGVTVTFWG